MIRLIVDENIPLITVRSLSALAHDVVDIRGTDHEGMSDQRLWALAQAEKRLLITTYKGFSQYRQTHHHGILIVRLSQANRDRIHERIMRALTEYAVDDWPGRLVVMRDIAQSTWLASQEP